VTHSRWYTFLGTLLCNPIKNQLNRSQITLKRQYHVFPLIDSTKDDHKVKVLPNTSSAYVFSTGKKPNIDKEIIYFIHFGCFDSGNLLTRFNFGRGPKVSLSRVSLCLNSPNYLFHYPTALGTPPTWELTDWHDGCFYLTMFAYWDSDSNCRNGTQIPAR